MHTKYDLYIEFKVLVNFSKGHLFMKFTDLYKCLSVICKSA